MAIQLEEEHGGKMLVVQVSGKLEGADCERFVPTFERLVRQHGRIRCDFQHFADIERLAMVGEKKQYASRRSSSWAMTVSSSPLGTPPWVRAPRCRSRWRSRALRACSPVRR